MTWEKMTLGVTLVRSNLTKLAMLGWAGLGLAGSTRLGWNDGARMSWAWLGCLGFFGLRQRAVVDVPFSRTPAAAKDIRPIVVEMHKEAFDSLGSTFENDHTGPCTKLRKIVKEKRETVTKQLDESTLARQALGFATLLAGLGAVALFERRCIAKVSH